MSLKAFHLVFIVASVLMMTGFSVWGGARWRETGDIVDLCLSVLGGLAAAGLVMYGRYFLKKLKHISYL
ncbi:MAG: hypothetical protein EXS36_03330 [Pedosphaera sp.]|nr:hypothetical protein [Pedosphaera sp.]